MLAQLAGLLVVLTLGLLSPGPDFLLVVKNSLGTTRARALGTVAGIAAGLAVQMLVISVGFAAAPARVLRGVQFGGATFLAWVGWRALRAAPDGPAPDRTEDGRAGACTGFVEGLLCNLTNPKAFLFFVSLFAQVLRPGVGVAAVWRIILPAAVVAHGTVAWTLVSLAVQSPPVERRIERAQHWLPRAFGGILIALAALIAWEAWSGGPR
jgi:threonine/homoserine/homoserine lactone efflux protein